MNILDQIQDRLNNLTQEQYVKLCKVVQINIDPADIANDVVEAIKDAPLNTNLYTITDNDGTTWLFIATSENEILELLNSHT